MRALRRVWNIALELALLALFGRMGWAVGEGEDQEVPAMLAGLALGLLLLAWPRLARREKPGRLADAVSKAQGRRR